MRARIDTRARRTSSPGRAFELARSPPISQAMSTGQTPALAELELDANRIGDQGLTALAGALLVAAPGTMALTELGLGNGYGGNLIGDVGLLSLLQAARAGRLARLRRLTLSNNEVSDEAAAQLTEIISEGAMPALRLVALQSNFIADYRLRPLSEECKRRSVTLLSSAQLTRSAHLQASAWVAA
jgi:hypothetical protein